MVAVADDAEYIPAGCATVVTHYACVDPISLGAESPNCNQLEKFTSCTSCEPCYEQVVGGSFPNNELGDWSNHYYICTEQGFNSVGTSNTTKRYEYRECSAGNYEFRCNSSIEYIYQSETTVKCTVKQKTDGTISFTGCRGCSICDETNGHWITVTDKPAYQQWSAYKYTISASAPATCPLVPQDTYQCNTGYYGIVGKLGTNLFGCKACPTLADAGLTVVSKNDTCTSSLVTAPAGSTEVTDCYATTGNNGSDVSYCVAKLSDGTGTFFWAYDDTVVNTSTCNWQ